MSSATGRIRFLALMAIALVCLIAQAGLAKTYYVSPDGYDDVYGGTKEFPWASINYGDLQNLLQPGDTVVVTAGTYFHNTQAKGTINKCSGTAEAPITYIAQGKVIINGTGNTGAGVFIAKGVDYIIFDGFEVFGSRRGLNINGVYVATGAQDLSEGVIVRNCIFRNQTGGYGIQTQHNHNSQIYNNLIYTYDAGENPGLQRGITGVTAFGNKIYNNTIITSGKNAAGGYDASVCGGVVFGSISPLANPAEAGTDEVKNNIIWVMQVPGTPGLTTADAFWTWNAASDGNGWYGIAFQHSHNLQWPDALNSTWTYRDLFPGWPHAFFNLYLIGIPNHYNEFYADPGLVDPANNDLRLAPGSPAIDAGVDVGLPYTGSAPDLGALETPFVTDKVGDLLAKGDGLPIQLDNAVVTAGSDAFLFNVIYVEDESRAAGIRVHSSPDLPMVSEGDRVQITGKLTTILGERAIQAASITPSSGEALEAVGMVGKAVSGEGLNSCGLLAKIWGKVTYIDESGTYFCIDDGSGVNDGLGNAGVPVDVSDMATPIVIAQQLEVGDYVSVTGVLGKSDLGGGSVSVIRPRAEADIR